MSHFTGRTIVGTPLTLTGSSPDDAGFDVAARNNSPTFAVRTLAAFPATADGLRSGMGLLAHIVGRRPRAVLPPPRRPVVRQAHPHQRTTSCSATSTATPRAGARWLAGCHVRMAGHSFRGDLWKHDPDNPGSWHFITLPLGVADCWPKPDPATESGPSVSRPASETLSGTPCFPGSSSGSFLLPVKRQVRHAERLESGSSCQVTLRPVN